MAGTPHPPEVQQEALRLLVEGNSVADVAAELDVAVRTVRRWARDVAPPPRPIAPVVRLAPAAPVVTDDCDEEAPEESEGGMWLRSQIAAALRPDGGKLLRPSIVAQAVARLREPTVERLAELWLRILAAQDVALDRGDLGALTRLLSLEARIQQLDSLNVQVEHSGAVELRALSPDDLMRERRRTAAQLIALPGGAELLADLADNDCDDE